MKNNLWKISLVFLCTVIAQFQVTAEEHVNADLKLVEEKYPTAITTKSGLKYIITKPGSGEKSQKGQKISVHYVGTLLNNKVFDSSVKRDRPFDTKIGVGLVIKGWDEGILDMAKGEKRKLIIPPHLGYGKRGAGRVIPPNAWLVFDVELLNIE